MKVLRWLRSRPLARVRRNLATQQRIRADGGMSAEIKQFYTRELLDAARQGAEIRELRRLAGLDKVER
jgi:hypothetical protein